MPRSDFSGYPKTVNTAALSVYLDEHLRRLYSEAERGLKIEYPDSKDNIREIAAWVIVGKFLKDYGAKILSLQSTEIQYYLKQVWRCRNCKSKETPVFYGGKLVCAECAHEYPEDSILLREMNLGDIS